MPAKKTKTVKKTKIDEPVSAPVQPVAPTEPAPAPIPTPAPAPIPVPPTAVAETPAETTQVKPELVKAAAVVTVEPVKEEAPNLDGWIAVKELVPQGQGAKNTIKGGLFFLLGLILGLAIGAGGMWWWGNKDKTEVANKTNSIVKDIKKATGISGMTSGAASPSATPAVGIARKDVMVLVQNGSGVKGAAGVAADMLTGLGYEIAGTGNAKGGPYAESELQVKQGKTDITKLLENDLAGKYTLSKTVGTVEETATYDAVLIVGKK